MPTTKRQIPYDKPIKLVLLALHLVGFSAWYGAAILGAHSATAFTIMATASGVLLTVRELYKDGFEWLTVTEGVLTWAKVLLLIIGSIIGRYEVVFLSVVLLFGLLSSHLPDEVREKRLFG
jgi:hypothetical protein